MSETVADDAGVPESQASAKTTKGPVSAEQKRPSLVTWVKVSSVIAFVTTYAHFFGYSFVKGKILAAGFHSSNVELHVDETLYQASAGTAVGIGATLRSVLLNDTLAYLSGLFSLFAAILVVLHFATPALQRKLGPHVDTVATWRGKFTLWVKIPASIIFASIFAFVLPYLSVMLVLAAVIAGWAGLTAGERLGADHVNDLKQTGVCKALDWSEHEDDLVTGCTHIKLADKSSLRGRFLYLDKSQSYFLTNHGSYHLDVKREVMSATCYHKQPSDFKLPDVEIVCAAECESECRRVKGEKNFSVAQ